MACVDGVKYTEVHLTFLVRIPDENHSSAEDVVLSPAQIVLPVVRVQERPVMGLLQQSPAVVRPAVLSQEPGLVQGVV